MSELAIEAQKLTKQFASKTAVNGIDLAIKPGEIYGFLGPNGAGKSTTIRMLVTLMNPSAGDAFIEGISINHHPEKVRLNIGVALQEAALDESQTGIEFLYLQGRLYGMSRAVLEKRLEFLKALVDIGDALNRRISTYSGGMKRRLDLAAALIHNPNILFLDEPTTGLDPISRQKVWDEVRRLNKDLGMTIFLTTQYLEEADQLADRVGIIANGSIVAEGTPSELKRTIGSDVITLETDADPQIVTRLLKKVKGVDGVQVSGKELRIATKNSARMVSEVALLFSNNKIALKELTLRTASLDDVFLSVTGNTLAGEKERVK